MPKHNKNEAVQDVEAVTNSFLSEIVFSRTSYSLTDKFHKDYPEAVKLLSKGHKYDPGLFTSVFGT